jgi:hypothetical protein
MQNGKFASLKSVMERITREIPNNYELDEGDVIEWIWEAVVDLGVTGTSFQKNKIVPVVNFRCRLPLELQSLLNVYYIHSDPDDLLNEDKWKNNIRYELRYSGKSNISDINVAQEPAAGYVFSIRNGIIQTSFEEGILDLHYTSFPVDEDMNPLVPEIKKVLDAVVSYVVAKVMKKAAIRDISKFQLYKELSNESKMYMKEARAALLAPQEYQMQEIVEKYYRTYPNEIYRNPNRNIGNTPFSPLKGDEVNCLLKPNSDGTYGC